MGWATLGAGGLPATVQGNSMGCACPQSPVLSRLNQRIQEKQNFMPAPALRGRARALRSSRRTPSCSHRPTWSGRVRERREPGPVSEPWQCSWPTVPPSGCPWAQLCCCPTLIQRAPRAGKTHHAWGQQRPAVQVDPSMSQQLTPCPPSGILVRHWMTARPGQSCSGLGCGCSARSQKGLVHPVTLTNSVLRPCAPWPPGPLCHCACREWGHSRSWWSWAVG